MQQDDKKRQTVYMPPKVHKEVRLLAVKQETSQQDLFRQAMNLLFEKYGIASWEELAKPNGDGQDHANAA